MIDILYLTHNRREFTEASLAALYANTNWSLVRNLWWYDDFSTDGTERLCQSAPMPPGNCNRIVFAGKPGTEEVFGGPVAIMNHFLQEFHGDVFCKLDNDVIVPPGWLDQCVQVMDAHPELDLLGIEPPKSRTRAPWQPVQPLAPELCAIAPVSPGYARCDAIGGIGLMRGSAFVGRDRMQPHGQNGVGGFTDWQWRNRDVVKGWICPPLDLFLLDRLPVDPWRSLSAQYEAKKWQRPWTRYAPEDHALWDWWAGCAVR